MAVKITKEGLLNDLDNLKKITELPDLYLANYFEGLRNKVDKEFATKQQELKNDREKKKELDKLWLNMITKIDSFEKNCIRKIYNLDANRIKINELEIKLKNDKFIDLKQTQDEIDKEENNLLQNLFQNKTILFRKHPNDDQSIKKIIDGQLIFLGDEFISQKSIDEGETDQIKAKIIAMILRDKSDHIIEISLQLNNLQKLNLEGNEIKELKKNSFIDLNNLQVLHLDDNKITELEENSFNGLENLQELSLSNNQIKELRENSFNGLINLQRLILFQNQIVEINENSFRGLNNLRMLDLRVNQITKINENSFNSLKHLEWLHLVGNEITEITDNLLRSLNNLTMFDLGGEKITEANLKSIKRIALANWTI